MIYNFFSTRQPQPGGMALAFVNSFGLPAFSPVGPGTQVRGNRGTGSFRVLQPPQVFAPLGVTTAGLGGIVAGTPAFQGLIGGR